MKNAKKVLDLIEKLAKLQYVRGGNDALIARLEEQYSPKALTDIYAYHLDILKQVGQTRTAIEKELSK